MLYNDNMYDCCRYIEFYNLFTSGPKFTWTNKRRGMDNVKERLDRFLANDEWRKVFPNAKAMNCGYFGSEHRAIKLMLNHRKWMVKKNMEKLFVFENKWLLENSFQEVARKCWEEAKIKGTLPNRLAYCGELLQRWAINKVGNTKNKINTLVKEIDTFLLDEENDENEENIINKQRQLVKLFSQEEVYWQQRSRMQWLKAGDQNTSFFHQIARTRRSRNWIEKIVDDEGRAWIS